MAEQPEHDTTDDAQAVAVRVTVTRLVRQALDVVVEVGPEDRVEPIVRERLATVDPAAWRVVDVDWYDYSYDDPFEDPM